MSSISSLEILPLTLLRPIPASNLLRCLKLKLTSKMFFKKKHLEGKVASITLEGKVAQTFVVDPNCTSIPFTIKV